VRVLIVEDDVAIRKGLESAVRDLGSQPKSVGTVGEAGRVVEEFDPEVLIVDVNLPDGDGIEVLRAAREAKPDRDGIVLTGQATIDSAVEALRAGASDYLMKPLRAAQLEVVFQRLAARRTLESEVETLRAELQETGKLGELIGKSPAMVKVFDTIRRVARSNTPVLITGQSGTGKEVVARTIHRLSRRASGPFVAFNCGAISPTLIESELFGHERGAFTGADKRRIGYFEEANGGTLLLDEITEMGAELQVKLLRVLEAKTVRRVGGTQEIRVDVRLISATNRDPKEAIDQNKLREDLYYRLNVFPLALPLLSERPEDIALLAEHFRRHIEEQEKAGVTSWDPAALSALEAYGWPGNVRELRNVVHRAYVMTEGDKIRPEVLDELLPGARRPRAARTETKRRKR
jgi:DNA-binding NtrC family response regulator